jgi:hypothetical protein
MWRVADEESFPNECFALPEKSLAVLIHLGPEADVIEAAVQLDLEFVALDEHEVAVAGTADAFVANGFARDLHGAGIVWEFGTLRLATDGRWVKGACNSTDSPEAKSRRRTALVHRRSNDQNTRLTRRAHSTGANP